MRSPSSEGISRVSADELRTELVAYSRRLVSDGLCIGTAGNLSVRAGDQVLITPSSISADELKPEQMTTVDIDGHIVDAPARPSSELPLHLAAYAATDAGAVVHTHSPYATVLSTTVEELPAIHYTINGLGGPVRVVPYATFGSSELADGVRAGLDARFGAIIQNHGTVTIGRTLAEAFYRAELLEWLATLYWRGPPPGGPPPPGPRGRPPGPARGAPPPA